jgi:AcrR family transcriptional regulator
MSTRIAKRQSVMRKAPRQARSRATVDNIIQAATRILADAGWAGFTTNKVADLAGVSIGSLYQYFPDKLSLVDAVRQRHLDDCLAVMHGASTEGLSPEEFTAQLVTKIVAAHSINPGLHGVLLDEAPSSAPYRDPRSRFEVEYLSYYARAVATYRGREPTSCDHLAGRVISDAIDGVIHNAARRGEIGSEALHAELAKLIGFYLARSE